MNRGNSRRCRLLAGGSVALGAALFTGLTFAAEPNPILSDQMDIQTMRVMLHRRATTGNGGFAPRDNCPQISTHTDASFTGGTYTIQAGLGEGEIAAASYTLAGNLFPLKITLMEMIFAQQAAVVQTTTQWSVIVWDGFPTDPQPQGFPVEFSSDGQILPHIVMGPGTRGTNVQAQVDPQDPDQIYIYNPTNAATHSFTVGYRVDHHNAQTANPCFTAPPSDRNAFPCTDNTQVGCCIGYGQLTQPTQNWLYALNCGANGCPPNGGWTRFSGLQTELCFASICLSPGCRPHGDWVMRVTWDPVNCPPPEGACCFGTFGCFLATAGNCQTSGGTWRGPGTVCGTNTGGGFPGCIAPPNQPPTANAGPDKNVTDTDNSGAEVVVVDGSGSSDPDGFIASYRWSEGSTILQDGPALLSHSFPVGTHTLTLRVTDNGNATATDTAVVTVNPGCVADMDNGTGTGVPDGGVTIDDLLYYLAIFDAGNLRADVDDGTGTGHRDGGVTIDDLLYYLFRFDLGC